MISPELEAKWDERIAQMETSSDAQMAGVADCLKDIATSWMESEPDGTDADFIEFMIVCSEEMELAAQGMIADLRDMLTGGNPAKEAPKEFQEPVGPIDTVAVNGISFHCNRELLRQQAAAVGRIIEDAKKFPTLGSVKEADLPLMEGVWEMLHRILDAAE